jgi:EAL domain-containing protein (putative c-di-GMP-specific phosphodiesterase class I)
MTDRSHVRAIGRSLRPLRDAGVQVALDDIGARYAWLHHMLWLEPDFLKLDRAFVRGAARSSRRRDLIAGMVSFASRSGAEIVAEGIETAAERDVLRDAAITFGQGYLLGMPLAAQEWFAAAAQIEGRTRVAGLME